MKVCEPELHLLGSAIEDLLMVIQLERLELGLPADAPALAKDRSTLEKRLAVVFEGIDPSEMPSQWSWERAALAMAEHIVVQMLLELRDNKQIYLH